MDSRRPKSGVGAADILAAVRARLKSGISERWAKGSLISSDKRVMQHQTITAALALAASLGVTVSLVQDDGWDAVIETYGSGSFCLGSLLARPDTCQVWIREKYESDPLRLAGLILHELCHTLFPHAVEWEFAGIEHLFADAIALRAARPVPVEGVFGRELAISVLLNT